MITQHIAEANELIKKLEADIGRYVKALAEIASDELLDDNHHCFGCCFHISVYARNILRGAKP